MVLYCFHSVLSFWEISELPEMPLLPPFPFRKLKTFTERNIKNGGRDSRVALVRCGFDDPWVRKSPWSRKWQPTPVFLPGESHGQRSLVGYSPRGHKETDTPEAP